MTEETRQPKPDDAVLGGNHPDISTSVVLGGIEGVIKNLKNGSETVKLDALTKALDYGKAGINLVIKALEDTLPGVRIKAYNLLKNRTQKQALKAIEKFVPFPYFECLKTLEGHSDSINLVQISPNGNHIISSGYDNRIKVWDMNTGQCLNTIYLHGYSYGAMSLAISPDGNTIVSCSWDNPIKVWDINTGECLKTLSGHFGRVSSVIISPNGNHIISGSCDNTIKVWDINTGECLKTLECLSMINGIFNEIWNPRTQRESLILSGGRSHSINSVAITPDSQKVITGSDDKTIKILDITTGECLMTLLGHSSNVNAVVISPNGQKIISNGWDYNIKIWDINTGKCLKTLKGHVDNAFYLAVSPNGNHIICGSHNNTIKILGINTGKCIKILEGHSDYVRSVAISPNGNHIISASNDRTIKIWGIPE